MGETKITRDSEQYSDIYRTFLRRGARGLTDVEARALTISSGGTALAPTAWSKYIDTEIAEDAILSRVQKIETPTAFNLPIYAEDATVNTNVAESALGTQSSPTFAKPVQGTSTGTSATYYTFAQKKVTAWVKVSNELLNDSKGAQDVEEFLRRALVDGLIGEVSRQILIGNGTSECQGSFNSAKGYSRTASTGVATTNTIKDVISAVWGSTNSALSPLPYESWINSVAVVNSRLVASFDSTFFPVLFPTFRGTMVNGTTVEGLPTVYHRLSATTPAAGDTLVHFFNPAQYLLAHSFGAFSVARYSETAADTNETIFVASIRCDGSITNKFAVLNVNRA
jgi:HK97 family phage major capsid protein